MSATLTSQPLRSQPAALCPPTSPTLDFGQSVGRLAARARLALVSIARAEGAPEADLLDCVQDAITTFLTLPSARLAITDTPQAAALLATLTRNAARNLRRKHSTSAPHVSIEDVELFETQPSVDALIAEAQAHTQVTGCIETLGKMQREVATLRFLEQFSNEATAHSLGIDAGHAAVLLHRSKRSLAQCLSAMQQQEGA